MFLLDDAIVTSPSDLTLASKCEFAFALQLDARLGKVKLEKVERDPIEARAASLGDGHELRHLQRYRDQFEVVELNRPPLTIEGIRQAAATTEEALKQGAPVVFQATFFDETDPAAPLIGYADFLVRQPDGRYRVQDTKLARSVKVTALLQLAGYHAQLQRLGIPVDDTVELILGTDEVAQHSVADIAPVYRQQRARLIEIVRERVSEPDAVGWGDPRYAIDGRCEICDPHAVEHRDVLLTAGLKLTQRAKLLAVGIHTIDDLAATTGNVTGIPQRTFDALRSQAQLQLGASADGPPPFQLFDTRPIADLPLPDEGDIYFDFEGDPLYSERRDGETLWGIDYLFGLTDRAGEFTAFWAHDLAQEKVALEQFLDWVLERRARHPAMHIYHYASYERTHLLSLAARHRHGEHIVDDLLREGVLVDLYPIVKKSVRVGGRSYSIKKLEPLYMGDDLREGVDNAADSIVQYNVSRETQDPTEAQRILDDIADYNRYDCVSTHQLHLWLLRIAAEQGVVPGTPDEVIERLPFEPSPLSGELHERATDARTSGDLTGAVAYELASASVDYHRREDKSFWWEHYARLEYPVDEWESNRGVFLVESGRVVADWQLARTASHRILSLTGEWAPGSSTSPRDAFTLYEPPGPFANPPTPVGFRLAVTARDIVDDDGRVELKESTPGGVDPWEELPIAVVPGPPPGTTNLKAAIERVGSDLRDRGPGRTAIGDILWRQPARTRSGPLAVAADPDDTARAVTLSILDLDSSFVAVQGPPGTGKTYLAAHVIATLVADHGWKVGVVAQSHKVVENVLRGIVDAGLPAALVGKAPGEGGNYSAESFTALDKDGQAGFATRNPDGYVIGGTSWDFTNPKRVTPGALDLLVIDEAGQFSLAATIAVSVAARNLLLLGDPQQLPQVSQGTHPAPIDQSALGYLADGHAVLPAELGYFLEQSRRMHSAVAAAVSDLSYDGALRAHPSTDQRYLAGVAPGLHPMPVEHGGNSTNSPEEATRVLELVEQHLGLVWQSRTLTEHDIIVVTPYNAQVEEIRVALAAHPDVRVGTVDKFQGQEAAISIVSLAASSAEDVPRGVDFLLNRNRLNVAISRAQWAAYLVYSPGLTRFLPLKPEGVAELSRFLTLVGS